MGLILIWNEWGIRYVCCYQGVNRTEKVDALPTGSVIALRSHTYAHALYFKFSSRVGWHAFRVLLKSGTDKGGNQCICVWLFVLKWKGYSIGGSFVGMRASFWVNNHRRRSYATLYSRYCETLWLLFDPPALRLDNSISALNMFMCFL
jgi:hypothetical protein